MTIDADRICRCCGDNKMVFGKAPSGAVIHGDAIFTQHQTIAGFTNIQLSKSVAINFIQERRGIGTLHINFAKCCDITDTN